MKVSLIKLPSLTVLSGVYKKLYAKKNQLTEAIGLQSQ